MQSKTLAILGKELINIFGVLCYAWSYKEPVVWSYEENNINHHVASTNLKYHNTKNIQFEIIFFPFVGIHKCPNP